MGVSNSQGALMRTPRKGPPIYKKQADGTACFVSRKGSRTFGLVPSVAGAEQLEAIGGANKGLNHRMVSQSLPSRSWRKGTSTTEAYS